MEYYQKKILNFSRILTVIIIGVCVYYGIGNTNVALANPTCIMMKFTDDTRFDKLDTAGTLSELVMERLVQSGKYNFKETKVIDENIERLLYDENASNMEQLRQALQNGNFSEVFEGAGFNDQQAQTIDTARLGQFVNPGIISSIGRQHDADYLIQGTVVNFGRGDENDYTISTVGTLLQSHLTGSGIFGSIFTSLLKDTHIRKLGIGVVCDFRVIKADSGEVVWRKCIRGKNISSEVNIGEIAIGSNSLSSEIYYKAVNDAANQIADALIADNSLAESLMK